MTWWNLGFCLFWSAGDSFAALSVFFCLIYRFGRGRRQTGRQSGEGIAALQNRQNREQSHRVPSFLLLLSQLLQPVFEILEALLGVGDLFLQQLLVLLVGRTLHRQFVRPRLVGED